MEIKLEASADGRPFVWAIAVGPDKQSELLALTDEKSGRNFIPVWITKREGQDGMGCLFAAGAPQGEVQAVPLEDMAGQAFASGLGILVLDREGKILGEFTDDEGILEGESQEDQSE